MRLSAALDPDDAINIQFTSGTTGSPKGATLTHFNIVNNARYAAKAMALFAEDRLCIPVPLYHCFGMVLGVLTCTAVGAGMVFPGEGFDAEATLAAVARYKCTALHGVPTMFIAQLEHPNFANYDTSTLRTGIMAGAPCPIDTMRAVIDRMHMREVTIGYGMTETSPLSFQSRTDDPIDRRVSTVGRILPHVEVKIVDANGKVARLGESGELCTRGYGVMRGYWDDPERSAEAIDAAGWMHSGDLATIDEQGYCTIVGRLKDMLIRGGENIYPREIEEFLAAPPEGAIRAGLWRPRSSPGRRSLRLHRAQAQPVGDGGGNSIILPRPDFASQSAALHSLRAGISHDGDRQAAKIRHARTDRRRIGGDARNSACGMSAPIGAGAISILGA